LSVKEPQTPVGIKYSMCDLICDVTN